MARYHLYHGVMFRCPLYPLSPVVWRSQEHALCLFSSPYYYHFLITAGRSANCICCTPKVGKTSRVNDYINFQLHDHVRSGRNQRFNFGRRLRSASFMIRLGWKVLTGVWHPKVMTASLSPVFLPTQPRRKALPFFGAYLLGPPSSDPAMPYVPTTRTMPFYFWVLFSSDVSASRACFGSFRVLHSNYVRGSLKYETTLC